MLLVACLGAVGRLPDLPFRPAPIRIGIHLSSILCQTFLDDAVRNREHLIHESREAFVLG